MDTPSYNEYGDYILYRPNAETDDPIYGLKVGYTVEDFPSGFTSNRRIRFTGSFSRRAFMFT